jgi:hypothetical protein
LYYPNEFGSRSGHFFGEAPNEAASPFAFPFQVCIAFLSLNLIRASLIQHMIPVQQPCIAMASLAPLVPPSWQQPLPGVHQQNNDWQQQQQQQQFLQFQQWQRQQMQQPVNSSASPSRQLQQQQNEWQLQQQQQHHQQFLQFQLWQQMQQRQQRQLQQQSSGVAPSSSSKPNENATTIPAMKVAS